MPFNGDRYLSPVICAMVVAAAEAPAKLRAATRFLSTAITTRLQCKNSAGWIDAHGAYNGLDI